MSQLLVIIRKYIKRRKKAVIVAVILFVVSAALAMMPAKIMQKIIDDAFNKYRLDALFFYVCILLLVYVAKAICTLVSNDKLISLGNDLLKEIKKDIYEKLIFMDLSFHNDNDIGFINARVEEAGKIDALFSAQTLSMGTSVLEFVFSIIMLFSISPTATVAFLCPIPVLLVISFRSARKITDQIRKTLDSAAEYSGKMQETLQGIETIKSQGTEKKESEKIDQYNRKVIDNHKKQSFSLNKFSTSLGSMGNLVTVAVYLIGGIFFIRRDLTMGAFIAISAYAGKLYSPILSFASVSIVIQPALLAMKRVSEFFFRNQTEDDIGSETLNEISDIEFKSICFSYNEKQPVLRNTSLKIEKGERIQLIGKNGSGKSTLIRLLLKVLKPQKGEIKINGINIQNIKRGDILGCIAYVPQKNYLFNESVQYNILYGIDKYSVENYEYILQGLDLHSVSQRVEKENNGKVGENGAKLSGGEIKKICIARALLRECSVMILDEAMANIDEKSINFIIHQLEQSDKTMLVIDHFNDFGKQGFKKIEISSLEGEE